MRKNTFLIIFLVIIILIGVSFLLYQNHKINSARFNEKMIQRMIAEISRKESKEEIISIIKRYGFDVDESHTVEEMLLSVYSQMGYDLKIFTKTR